MTDEPIREKSLKEKKLESILGIGESLKNFDKDESANTSSDDADKKHKFEERKKYLAEMKEDFDKVKSKPDLEFSRDIYKELVMIDMEMLRITRKEMEIDPSPRYVETAGSLTNSITSTLDSLRDIEEVKVDQGFEREKIEMKKNSGNLGPGAGVVMIGSMSDILMKIKAENQIKTIEAVTVVTDSDINKKD